MKFLEKTLEDMIWEAYEDDKLYILEEHGLKIKGTLYRQHGLGSYGTADLISIEMSEDKSYAEIVVYELKLNKIDVSALMQACRYVTAIKRHAETSIEKTKVNCRVCLIGEQIENVSDFPFLYNQLGFVDIYTYRFSYDGLFFRYVPKTFCRQNEYFVETLFQDGITHSEKEEDNLPF